MSIEFTVTQHFDAAPDRVYDALTDLEGAAEWMPGLVGIRRLTDGAFGPGTEWDETRKIFGREATERFEVTACERPRHIALRVDGAKGTSKRGEYLFEYRLEPGGEGTDLTLHGEIRDLGAVMGFLGRFMKGPYRKACAKDLEALARHLDSGAA